MIADPKPPLHHPIQPISKHLKLKPPLEYYQYQSEPYPASVGTELTCALLLILPAVTSDMQKMLLNHPTATTIPAKAISLRRCSR
eukprot:scaffold87830_cov36-Cyclotella_meneghiniana.AAC.1